MQSTVGIPLADMALKILDPHLHFFDKSKGEYAWLHSENPPFWPDKQLINRNFKPQNLRLNSDYILHGAVHIEAGFDNEKPNREVAFLESEVYPELPQTKFKTIGYIDVFAENMFFKKQLSLLKKYGTFVGVRCIFEANSCEIRESLYLFENLKLLQNEAIIFELQADFSNTKLIKSLLDLVILLPRLSIVINHAGLAPFNHDANYVVWESNIKRFAALPFCFVKCSGFEMINRAYSKDDVTKVLASLVAFFGFDKMLLASNFPLTLFSVTYAEYWRMLIYCAEDLQLPIKKVSYTNAKDLYQFS
jgi:predicted TIM-barrel fold metal-dependent hydrolase